MNLFEFLPRKPPLWIREYQYGTVKIGIIENLARTLELPLSVRFVYFSFLFVSAEGRGDLLAVSSPLNPKGEILDVLALFSIIPVFAALAY